MIWRQCDERDMLEGLVDFGDDPPEHERDMPNEASCRHCGTSNAVDDPYVQLCRYCGRSLWGDDHEDE